MARGMGGQRRAPFHPWRHSRGVDRSRRRLGAGPADGPRRADHRHARRLPKGAAPGDLPIEFPTKIERVINLKAAKVLGRGGAAGLARPRRRGDRITKSVAAVCSPLSAQSGSTSLDLVRHELATVNSHKFR